MTAPIVRPFKSGMRVMVKGTEVPKTAALQGVEREYSILLGQRFSQDVVRRISMAVQ